MFDRGFSALLADLHDRGLLDETLVVAMGEFGRTPKVGQITSSAGADKAAYPARDAVTPQDIAATIYRALGFDPETTITDPLDRPFALSTGTAITALVG